MLARQFIHTFSDRRFADAAIPLAGHEAQIGSREAANVGYYAWQIAGRYAEPCRQRRCVLINAGGWNPSSPRAGPIVGVVWPGQRQSGVASALSAIKVKIAASDCVAHDEMVTSPRVVRSGCSACPAGPEGPAEVGLGEGRNLRSHPQLSGSALVKRSHGLTDLIQEAGLSGVKIERVGIWILIGMRIEAADGTEEDLSLDAQGWSQLDEPGHLFQLSSQASVWECGGYILSRLQCQAVDDGLTRNSGRVSNQRGSIQSAVDIQQILQAAPVLGIGCPLQFQCIGKRGIRIRQGNRPSARSGTENRHPR